MRREKTIEQLENAYWGEPDDESYLVTTCHRLRQKPLKDFEVEDLRIMIGQDIGLQYLIPLALEVLKHNVLAEGDLYEGDLLKAVLSCEVTYWESDPKQLTELKSIIQDNVQLLQAQEPKLLKMGMAL